MRALVGTEEPVDPPVVRRALPFSRAWLAAFVLGALAVGWTAIVIEFDTRAERAHVDRLDSVVGDIEKAIAGDELFTVARSLGDLATITAGRAETGAEEVDRIWDRVELLARQARDSTDLAALTNVVAELRTATDQLDQIVTMPSDDSALVRR